MNQLLLKVKERFQITGRGVILTPALPLDHKLPRSASVTLVLPDSALFKAEADFLTPIICFSNSQAQLQYEGEYVCLLKNLKKEAVPLGTEVWLD